MKTNEVRKKYLEFFKSRGHTVVPSSSLIPENDPTTLFTGSGMQPMLQYLLGEEHPQGARITDSQKCFRADDINEIGDNRHTTFFEMLGNWSLGDYFKEEQLEWIFEFLIKELKLNPERLFVTVFAGDKKNNIPLDNVAIKKWQELFAKAGVSAKYAFIGGEDDGYSRGIENNERIFAYDSKKNWWSRAGIPENMPPGEPGGPDSEIFYDFGTEHDKSFGEHCHPNCDCGRFMEIGNNVFMMYKKLPNGNFEELNKKNIDFGGGLERLVAATNNNPDVFKIDIFNEMIRFLEKSSGKRYSDNKFAFRVIADHMRGATFIIGDGVLPGNSEQGYYARRLIRRSVRYADKLGIQEGELPKIVNMIAKEYEDAYPNLTKNKSEIKDAIAQEESRFRKTLQKGINEFKKLPKGTEISGKDAFILFTTYGFPIELTEELANNHGLSVNRAEFNEEMRHHKETSRAGAEQKFKGGLADNSEISTAFHTATHLMLAGLRKFLGEHITQKGSNITKERTRFDFTHTEKVSREILDKVEEYVNEAVKKNAEVITEEILKKDAQKDKSITGAFWDKYPEIVKVWTIRDAEGKIWSKELCGGPHMKNTGEIAKFGTFKITKEKAVAAGIRRVKGVFIK